MRKDYIPINDRLSESNDGFLEDYWTRHWANADNHYSSELIRSDEKFFLVDRYLSTLRPGATILDGGCGLGQWTVYYSAKGYETIGLDISQEVVETLGRHFPECKFIHGDLRATDFDEASFDGYFSWGAFEHLEEGLQPYFKEASRIIRPGGLLLISVPFQNRRHIWRDGRSLKRWDEHYLPGTGYPIPMRFYQWRLTRAELFREFELGGFECLEVKPFSYSVGLNRAVRHDLGINPRAGLGKLIRKSLSLVIPKSWVAHMIVGVGRRRG